MKYRFPSAKLPLARPTRANGALLPAACTAVLALLAALQLVMTREIELPPQGWSGGGARAPMPQIGGGMVPPVLQRTTIFSPERTAGGAPGQGPELLLGGNAVAGSVSVRGRAYAVVVRPDASVIRVPIGGVIAGKRLVSLEPDGAVFVSDGKRILVAYGAIAAPADIDVAAEEEQSQ